MNLSKYILAETEDWVAVNKPAGLLSIADRYDPALPCLSHLLEKRYQKVFIVHRLDKDTSGVLVFAKNKATHRLLSLQFQNREIEKTYLALTVGSMLEKEGTIDAPLSGNSSKGGRMKVVKKGLEATTHFEVLEAFSLYTLLKVNILTGRTHQIRVHLQSIGYPIAMDPLYGSEKPFYLSSIKRNYHVGKFETEQPLMSRQALHSSELRFKDTKGEVVVNAPLPKDFKAVLNQLKKHARF